MLNEQDIKDIKKRTLDIINNSDEIKKVEVLPGRRKISKTNGYHSNVTSIFVDIRESTKLFNNKSKTTVAKIIKSYSRELLQILGSFNMRENGVRGDCVYAIYNTPNKEDNYTIIDKAIDIHYIIKALNEVFKERKMPTIKVGIGIACGIDLVIGINTNSNKVWIGEAVTTSSHLCDKANKDNKEEILISNRFYNQIKDKYQKNENPNRFTTYEKSKQTQYYGYKVE